jgi:DNA helicase HerA-like ATPase
VRVTSDVKRTAVGTVVGTSSTTEFMMQVKPDAIRAQDLVAVDTIEDGERFRVWAKVGTIERLNPLFPREAAQELAFQGRDPVDSVVSLSREMVTATCSVVGVQRDGRLEPAKYPVQPASQVYVPAADEIESFLVGDTPEHRRLYLGTERGNRDVKVYVDAHMIVSRHLAVLASTGAGKTVATRKILEELMAKGYPILIFDPTATTRVFTSPSTRRSPRTCRRSASATRSPTRSSATWRGSQARRCRPHRRRSSQP